jgi:hypothetical protein
MAISFDGINKIATLSSGTTTLNVLDLYSRWVDWMLTSDNSKFLPMFTTVGGDTIDASSGTSVPTYAFLQNGWRIRPQEANHTLSVTTGVLLVQGGGDPFLNTVGNFIVRINYSQPVQAITVSTGGSAGGATAIEVRQEIDNNSTKLTDTISKLDTVIAYVDQLESRLTQVRADKIDNLDIKTSDVWNVDMATHTTAGTFGAFISTKLLTVSKFLGLK